MQDFSLKLKLQSKNKNLHVAIKKLHVKFSYMSKSGLRPIPEKHQNSKSGPKPKFFSITSKPPLFSIVNQHFPPRD